MIIFCEYCDTRCICYDDWIEHLVSDRHQQIISDAIDYWPLELNERSFVIYINDVKKPDKRDLCWYFANYGLVADVYFETHFQFCIVQLDKKEYAHQVLANTHHTPNSTLSIRLKNDFSPDEWRRLKSLSKGIEITNSTQIYNSFEDRHSKLISVMNFIPPSQQLDYFRGEIEMKSEEIGMRTQLINEITNKCRSSGFPACTLFPYGSVLTSLGSSKSILHVYFDTSVHQINPQGLSQDVIPHPTQQEVMNSFVQCVVGFNRLDFFSSDPIIELNSDMSCVRFNHRDTGIKCKFTFENMLPVVSSKLLSVILRLHPCIKDLFLFVRYWGEYHKLTGPYRITNYSLELMLVVFLVKQRHIMSISTLKSIGNNHEHVGNWNLSLCTDVDRIKKLMSSSGIGKDLNNTSPGNTILKLAQDFFHMYSTADLKNFVVCPLIGDLIPKTSFDIINDWMLSNLLSSYKRWARLKPENRLNTTTSLCVQDPFNLGCNVSQKTPESVFIIFQKICSQSTEKIKIMLSSPDWKILDIFKSDLKTNSPAVVQTKSNLATKQGSANSQNTQTGTTMNLDPRVKQINALKKSKKLPLEFGNHNRVLKMKPDQVFVEKFRSLFGNLESDISLNLRMYSLWCSFLSDFFCELYTKSFNFEMEEINPSKMTGVGDRCQVETLQYVYEYDEDNKTENFNPNFFKKQTVENLQEKSCKFTKQFTPHGNPHKEKYMSIKINVENKAEKAYVCYMKSIFNVGRGRARIDVANDKSLRRRFPNPLDLEKEASRIADGRLKTVMHKHDVFDCGFAIKITFDLVSEEISICLQDLQTWVKGKERKAVSGIFQHIISIIKTLIPRYVMFRFKSWMAAEKEQGSKLPAAAATVIPFNEEYMEF